MSNSFSKFTHGILKKILYSPINKDESIGNVVLSELEKEKPSMIARFGSTEIKAILYPNLPFFIRPFFKKRIFGNMYTLSGFFPCNTENIRKFSKMMIEDMKILDVLGSWRVEERFLEKYLSTSQQINLNTLEPYFQSTPWSSILKDKNVLVIHPFSKSIESQYYTKRELLFENSNVLPKFKSLQIIKAVQTIAGVKSEFIDWFEALESMKSEINQKDFDVAIIGCGAYGFPLAAHVKRMGKKAVHLGGPTQMLFGIKGKRWIENQKFDHIINEHFVFPNEEDKVENADKVEGACYW
jgi:hypothetical protein